MLAKSYQDLSAMRRAQRFQGDGHSIPVDLEVARGLKDLLNELAAFVFTAAVVRTDGTEQRRLDTIGDDLYCVGENLALRFEAKL